LKNVDNFRGVGQTLSKRRPGIALTGLGIIARVISLVLA
jgi:hypothetical protein